MVDIVAIFQGIFGADALTSEIIVSVIMFSIVAIIGWVSYFIFSRYFSRWAARTKTTLDDDILKSVKTIIILLIVIVGVYYAISPLDFISSYSTYITDVFNVVTILLVAFAITRVTNVLSDWYVSRRKDTEGNVNNHILFILKKVIQLVVFVIAFLVILYALHQDLSGIVVGLGVGGIAIALAVQNTLSDIFSAFSIYFDRPFEIGDFIVVGDNAGTVTAIGVKSTRVQLLQGEELVVSNKELTSTQVRNFKKLEKRRVAFIIGVTYDTPLEKLKKIPGIITDIINNCPLADLDRVHFSEFGDFSLKFETVYYVQVADYTKYMDVQQSIYFDIKEAFEKEGIEMAFPTHTVHLNQGNLRLS